MKIISFSLWGNNPKYLVGAIKNAKLARDLFPDWVCRFYCGTSVPHDTVSQLLDSGELGCSHESEIGSNMYESCDGKVQVFTILQPGDWRGMFWRFHAASDPNCEVMISRDCDSRLSLREKAAVDEWLASERRWHIMRDHPWHGSLMLGGMWGVKGCPAMSDWISTWNAEDRYQTDQDFLQTMVYPIARHDAMIHASFCNIEPDAIGFPTRREGRAFVGQVFDENDITVAEHEAMITKALKGRGELIRKSHLPQFLQDMIREEEAQ